VTRKDKSYPFFPSGIEWILLEEVQRGNKVALIYLFIGYLWFIKKLAKAHTPKDAITSKRIAVFTSVVEIFETCARTVPLHEHTCFLEEVLRATTVRFEDKVVRRKRVEKLQSLTETTRDIYTVSLDSPIPGTDELTLGETLSTPQQVSTERTVYLAQLRELVPKILANLPEDEHTVITHHLIDDYPFEDIARALNLRTETVRQKFKKGMRRLRHSLKLRT
jgi:RNA polymerase sigma factor (sigma-70 family)